MYKVWLKLLQAFQSYAGAYIHTYIHTYIHLYIYIYIYILSGRDSYQAEREE
jgi:hypothetical protein